MHYQPPKNLLDNHIILVTGANTGIGQQAALTYACHGARLVLLARQAQTLAALAAQITALTGHRPLCCELDYSTATPEQCRAVAAHISQQVPRLDGVLHNAGMLGEVRPMAEQTPEIWAQVMQVNVNVTFYLTQGLIPLLLKAPAGSLVFTSSSVGRQGRADWGAYAVSKFATEGMMQVLAEEYRAHNLRVNCINPGGTRTRMRASAFPTEDPLRLKTPTDIMPLYLWLMGADSLDKTGMSFDAQPNRKPGIAQ